MLIIGLQPWGNFTLYVTGGIAYLQKIGQGFGYFPQAVTAWLLIKPHLYTAALKIFEGSNASIIQHGQPYLGSPFGCSLVCCDQSVWMGA